MKLILFLFLFTAFSFDSHKFKKCKEKGWCNRLRNEAVETNFELFNILGKRNFFNSIVKDDKLEENLGMFVDSFNHGVIRIKMVENNINELTKKNVKYRLDIDKDILVQTPQKFRNIAEESGSVFVQTDHKTELKIPRSGPLKIDFLQNSTPLITFNEKSLLNMEAYYYKPGVNESFGDGERSGVSFDIFFHNAQHIYGLPERTVNLSLPMTNKDEEPYRLFNLDIFEYELNNKIGTYGNIPFVMTIDNEGNSNGLFFLNPTDMFIDLTRDNNGIHAHFVASNGLINVFFIPGPTPKDVIRNFVELHGFPFLPPKFSIGYHQCRWNYKDEEDVKNVDENFDFYDIPYDVIWLDIEHTDGKKYFTWDKDFFSDPIAMQNNIKSKGRKMVTISDPHIKNEAGYFVYDEAKRNNYFIKQENGQPYTGDCWPGKSSWLDFYNPIVRDYYASLFAYEKYKGSTDILYTWIDMNEPSVFSGNEITMDDNAIHFNDVKHRELHNVYGFYHAMATYDGHLKREKYLRRPYILTRSFFAGTQRYAAVWIGDNEAEWDHLKHSFQSLLTLSITGMPFVGADVGGFFKDGTDELLTRWYQAAIFYPFFRAHAHIETIRREPWLFGEDVTRRIRHAIYIRYVLYPYVYTAFYHSSITAQPILSPLFVEFPADKKVHGMDDVFMFSEAILARPVMDPACKMVKVYFPVGKWYDYFNGDVVSKYGQQYVNKPVDMDSIPMFIRGGYIVPMKSRLRRSSAQMKDDPITLKIALDSERFAYGELYIDDGDSFKYKEKEFLLRKFYFVDNTIKSNTTNSGYAPINIIEKIIIFGVAKRPKKVIWKAAKQGDIMVDVELSYTYEKNSGVLEIMKTNIPITEDFEIIVK